MLETNEEVTEKLKSAICDYYMGYIKQKLRASLADSKEAEISNQIMQFLDAQIYTGNSTITKDDISRILSSILTDGFSESFHSDFEEKRISYCFPDVADIKIEDGNAAYLKEVFTSPTRGTTEKSCYLYVSPDYYNNNIENIETEIKKLEKGFSRQDFKNFEQKFNEDLNLKQYELESARVYESASNQIALKKQKFKAVSSKMINDYGRKYAEITAKDISDEEKEVLYKKLLDETKSYDEKNRQAVARLNSEYEKLSESFQGKVQDSKTTYSQMQNLHLFDKNRYFEDMMAETEPKLRDLYKKRYLLNSYRTAHGEPIYSGKSNVFKHFITTAFNNIRYKNAPPMLGPHFERDFSNRRTSY